jgi:hypothetical protein
MNTGIEKITKAVEAIAEFGNIAGAALADGKINMEDVSLLTRLPSAGTKVFAVVTNFTDIRKEFADLDQEEKATLIKTFEREFDIPQDNVEATIEQAAALIDVLWDGYQAISIFAGKLKKK